MRRIHEAFLWPAERGSQVCPAEVGPSLCRRRELLFVDAFEIDDAAPAFFRQLPCWRWYGVSMVGVAELGIREYVWRKEPEEKKHEQLELNLPQAPSRGLHQTAP